MNILLTNDDGIKSKGIEALKKALLDRGHNLLIIAPLTNQSGCSHRMNFYKNIKLTKLEEGERYVEYSLTGSPSDCVKLGVTKLAVGKIDLVISGVNDLPNTGTDLLYSGTFNGAYEGTFNGIKSIAISASSEETIVFAVDFLMQNFDAIINNFFDKPYTININVPKDVDSVKGVAICPIGDKKYTDIYNVYPTDNANETEYYLHGDEIFLYHNPTGCDVNMLNDNYITISPIKIGIMTDFGYINKLKDIKLKWKFV